MNNYERMKKNHELRQLFLRQNIETVILKKKLISYRITSVIQLIIIAILSYLTVGCGGQIEGQAPSQPFEPRPHLEGEALSVCESIQASPSLSCCFGSACELRCSPHDGDVFCYVEYAQECLRFSEWEIECYENNISK